MSKFSGICIHCYTVCRYTDAQLEGRSPPQAKCWRCTYMVLVHMEDLEAEVVYWQALHYAAVYGALDPVILANEAKRCATLYCQVHWHDGEVFGVEEWVKMCKEKGMPQLFKGPRS
jgi:hypothetical protein